MTTTVIDASVVIPWLLGRDTPQGDLFDRLSDRKQAVIAPVTVTELLSGRDLDAAAEVAIDQLPRLVLLPEYWERAGRLRSAVIAAGRKARLGDVLLAQACIDHELPLLTADSDFRAFAEIGGLKLA